MTRRPTRIMSAKKAASFARVRPSASMRVSGLKKTKGRCALPYRRVASSPPSTPEKAGSRMRARIIAMSCTTSQPTAMRPCSDWS